MLPEIVLNKDEVVPGTGVEPVRLSAPDFKSGMSTNSITRADAAYILAPRYEKGKAPCAFPLNLERETSLELATSTLARLRSTN